MLSVDDTSFVKKGTHCIGVKRQYCGRTARSGYSFPTPGTPATVWWIMTFISRRNGSRTSTRTCVPDAGSRDTSVSLQRTGLPRASSTTRMGPDGSWHNGSDVTLRMDVTTPSCIQRIVCYHIRRNHRAYCLPTNFYPAPELLKMRIPDSICRIHKNV